MPKTTQLGGVMVPAVTNFDPRGESLDVAAFSANIQAYIDAGISGIVVTGSSGEAPFLTDAERAVLVEAARGIVPADRWLIAGVGAESTRQTVERAREAARRGADAVLVVPPHYFPQSTSAAALLAHYERIAGESPVPVLLYTIPQYMHYVLPPAVVERLVVHTNVIGMKDSGGDPVVLAGYLASQSSSFTVLTGHGGTLVTAIAAGVRGGILGIGLIAPALTLAAFEAARARHTTDAAALQAQLLPLAREVVGALGPAGIKAAMDAAGLQGGPVRAPLLALDEATRARVAALVDAALSTVPA
jgi:4-hydroxy-2-oxoglutarate aldolase